MSITPYIVGKESGFANTWYLSGEKKQFLNYLDGKLSGTQTWWYKSGKKDEERNYRKGIESGQRFKWFDNGKKIWKHITKMERNNSLFYKNFL
jgi:antitoxin component YwqK of YwqJK toxin-antitoxin module